MGKTRFSRRAFLGTSAAAAGGVAAAGSLAGQTALAAELPSQANEVPGITPNYSSPYARWTNGPNPTGRLDYFPLAVWLQTPSNAPKYQAIGINCYVGLYNGPTEDDLTTLASFGMSTICTQNAVGLAHLNDPTIIGWLQPDEPDNAQPQADGSYGPPVPAADIISAYDTMVSNDPTRPVYLGLGKGVADDTWIGRGVPLPWDDYYDYVHGGDISSFDIYPVSSEAEGVEWLWYPSKGVDRLHLWGDRYGRIVWNVIETTNISGTTAPTAGQIKSEVWMSIIHGSRGIVYFCHIFSPAFDETGLLDEPEQKAGVAALNAQITRLAPVLNSSPVPGLVNVETTDSTTPVDIMVRQVHGATYIFAAGMRNAGTTATFTLPTSVLTPAATVSVIDENRTISQSGGVFKDDFEAFGVHLYKITH